MEPDPSSIIQTVVERSPRWLRYGLLSNDKALRLRAEEAMAAMIAEALSKAPAS